MKARRYDAMIEYARARNPRTIMEIGTCKGDRAEQLIRAAGPGVRYFGFDLFDTPPAHEWTSKAVPDDIDAVRARLESTGAAIRLFKGPSCETIPDAFGELPPMDLIFIDGGHSAETVATDWDNASMIMNGPVFFDDYWNLGFGGCNATVDRLIEDGGFAVTILEPPDRYLKKYGWLETRLVRVAA